MASLPASFVDLEIFVPEWALKSEAARFQKLHQVTLAQLRLFYDALLPRMEEILLYLNQYKIQELPTDAKILFHLAMTFAETAHPIDLNWADVDFPDAYPWDKFEFRTVSTAEN